MWGFRGPTNCFWQLLKIFTTTKSAVPKKFHTHSPRPPAPRKIPPTASASHSLDTPMMMQPATMLSRAEPTRSPWYSPTLTGFIQQVEAPHLPFTYTASWHRTMFPPGPSLPLATSLSSARALPLPFFHSLWHRNTFSGRASVSVLHCSRHLMHL